MQTVIDRRDARVIQSDARDSRDAGYAPDSVPMRTAVFAPRRRHWPGVLAACVLGAVIAAFAVSSFYDNRTVGEKIDATVQATQQTVQNKVDGLKEELNANATSAARDGAKASDRAATAFNDAGITAAVKTALAADPKLSAIKIDVKTEGGVVSLQGPAPDDRSRDRAEVLAAAPSGVLRVDNRLVVSPAADPMTR